MTSRDFSDKSNIDHFRQPHESSAEWTLKREFLLAHREKFSDSRLECLANCYVNQQLFGCSYPPAVMEQIRVLKEGLSDSAHEICERLVKHSRIKFVKASESSATGKDGDSDATPKSKKKENRLLLPVQFVKSAGSESDCDETCNKRKLEEDQDNCEAQHPPSKLAKIEPPAPVHPQDVLNNLQSGDQFAELRPLLATSSLGGADANAVSLLHAACQKLQISITCKFSSCSDSGAELHSCQVIVDGACVAEDTNARKRHAKAAACASAVQRILQGQKAKTETSSADFQMSVGDRSDVSRPTQVCGLQSGVGLTPGQKLVFDERSPVAHFVLLESFVAASKPNPVVILQNSANFNRVLLNFRTQPPQYERAATCTVELMDVEVATYVYFDGAHNAAKRRAAEEALRVLRGSNWTLLVKKHAESDDARLAKSQLVDSSASGDKRIPDSNIGNKLLRQMGWTGGGVGAKGNEGRADPVSVDAVVNRSGLGLSATLGVTREFSNKIREVLRQFVADVTQSVDIAFAPDFSKDERAFIHREARKFALKSHSYGKDDQRYLVLSRKRSPLQVLQHVFDAGGETGKYKLIAPGRHPALSGCDGLQWTEEDADTVPLACE